MIVKHLSIPVPAEVDPEQGVRVQWHVGKATWEQVITLFDLRDVPVMHFPPNEELPEFWTISFRLGGWSITMFTRSNIDGDRVAIEADEAA